MAKRRDRNNRGKVNPAAAFRINKQIRVPEVRLVGEDFNIISEVAGREVGPGIFATKQLQDWAFKLDLDLVEISPKATPPVVKIIDFKKFLYNKKKKEKELKAKSAKTVVKEIRFGPNTDEHDFEFKLKHAKKFLEDGAKVKAFVQFRGITIVFNERGELILLRFLKELEELGSAEALPRMEGRRMNVIISPKKGKK